MTSEPTVCSRCNKPVKYTVSMTIPGDEPTPPLCSKCWAKACKAAPERVKQTDAYKFLQATKQAAEVEHDG